MSGTIQQLWEGELYCACCTHPMPSRPVLHSPVLSKASQASRWVLWYGVGLCVHMRVNTHRCGFGAIGQRRGEGEVVYLSS